MPTTIPPVPGLGLLCLAAALVSGSTFPSHAQSGIPITVSSDVPSELNPPFNAGPPITGGAPNATPAQAAAFAWQEFIALNWPAGPQEGKQGQRDTPSPTCKFGDPSCTGPLVWETFRAKAEIFPGQGNPPGYPVPPNGDPSFGYDALPQYIYETTIQACGTTDAIIGPTPWVNLDETDQITLDSMYAGVVAATPSATNSAPQLIRFLAKANRAEYVYVAGNSNPQDPNNQWWSFIPTNVAGATQAYLTQNNASPPAGSSTLVSLPYGTIEMKAGWRVLNPTEVTSGRYHMARVRYYEQTQPGSGIPCYRDDVFGLVALHIIQKTPSAPFFIYATFEQADNIMTPSGPLEDENGALIQPAPATATTPQVCLVDPQPSSKAPMSAPPGKQAQGPNPLVILTANPKTCQPIASQIPLPQQYCATPGQKLYYQNASVQPPSPQRLPAAGFICVNKRDFDIPPEVVAANRTAHAAIAAYLKQNGITSAPWLAYKLVNVQYFPFDKIPNPRIPNGSPYTAKPPFTARNPAPATFYQANIVVETNRTLQIFSGTLAGRNGSGANTDWDKSGGGLGPAHKNMYYGGAQYNMGGCMGCHGSQGQHAGGDFSVILANGAVLNPEYPAQALPEGVGLVPRNRLRKLVTP